MIVLEPSNLLAAPGLLLERPTTLRKRELNRFVALAREAAGVAGSVSVLLTHDEGIRRLNREFRKQDKSTDVLSFPAARFEQDIRASQGQKTAAALGGDLAISIETADRQAAEFGHDLETELKVLLLHGLLHLAGHDHERDQGQMARLETVLRKRFDLPSGLIQRTTKKPAATRSARVTKLTKRPTLRGPRP